MVRRVRRWVSVVSVLTLATVGAFAALPAGAAGGNGLVPIEPNCEPAIADQGVGAQGEGAFCAELEVTKVVTGEAAPGTTFDVFVECVPPENDNNVTAENEGQVEAQQLPPGHVPPYEETLTFPEEGGTQSIFLLRDAVCTVSEEPPAGCELVSIDPEVTEVQAGRNQVGTHVYPVTVTNDCPVEPAAEVIEVPAAPVAAAPSFTG